MVTFQVHTEGLEGVMRKLAEGCSKAEHTVALQAEKDTRPFVPALTTSLTTRTEVRGNIIIYPEPYARYLYLGKLMVDPETGSSWATEGVKKVRTDRNLVFNQTVHGQAQDHWFEASKAQNIDKWIRTAAKAVVAFGSN